MRLDTSALERRARREATPVMRYAAAVGLVVAASVVPAPADATPPAAMPQYRDAAWRDVAPELGPTEDVVPVAPSARETAQVPSWAPTSVSGRALAWPRLWAGETGIVSTYGPGYRGWLALPYPYGPGWRVEVCGPGGCITGISNDYGPERRLRRLADLDVPTWEAVCGVPWRFGLCTATVTVLGRAE